MPVDLISEQFLKVLLRDQVARPRRLSDVEFVQACLPPSVLVGFYDEGRYIVADRVAVDSKHAVRSALMHEGQPVEQVVGAEPNKLGSGYLDRDAQVRI